MKMFPATPVVALVGLALLACGGAAQAQAQGKGHSKCVKAYVCDEKGQNCKHQDVCPTYLEAEPPKTQGLKLPPQEPGQPKPLDGMSASPAIPAGASGCAYERQADGQWVSRCAAAPAEEPKPLTAAPKKK